MNIVKRISNPKWSEKLKYYKCMVYYSDGTSKWCTYARALMEQHLNRKLTSDECVVHIDCNQKNINIENLKILTRKELYQHMGQRHYEVSDKKSKAHPNLKIDYFENIDTKEKAYWLGFLYADGCLKDHDGKYTVQLGLKVDDKHWVEKFTDAIGGDPSKIWTSQRKDYGYTVATPCAYIEIVNKQFYQHLLNHGLHPRKSSDIIIPNSVKENKEILYAFILGYFDGDGYISKRSCGYTSCGICSGSEKFLREIKDILELDSNITTNKCHTLFKLYVSTKKLIELYNNYSDMLPRKRKLLEEYIAHMGNNTRDRQKLSELRKLLGVKKLCLTFRGKPIQEYYSILSSCDNNAELSRKLKCSHTQIRRMKKNLGLI